MDNRTGAERQHDGDRLASWLVSYRPQGMDEGTWAKIRPFVLGCVDRLYTAPGASGARLLRVMARLAAWCVRQGLPLDAEVVLDPDTVERFAAMGLADERSRATYRAVLRRVGPLLTTKAPWEARPATLARRQVAVPYTDRELEGLAQDALSQPTAPRRQAARALLALGLGAGLDGRWITRVRAEDIIDRNGAVLVRVAEPATRVVPVLAGWQDEVLALAAGAGEEFLVGGRSTARNRANALAASLVTAHGRPRFSASRLRSTWLVTHLRMGTRLPELARAAGLSGVTVLSDLLDFVPALADSEAHQMLRGQR